MKKLTHALHRQLRLNSSANLLHPDVTRLLEINPTFLAALEEVVASPSLHIQAHELAKLTASALIERVYRINQFIQVDQMAREGLEDIYLGTWARLLEANDIESCLRAFHYPRLGEWISKLYPAALKKALTSNLRMGQVVCQNYSAELQLDLLKLQLHILRQPVLDIGCGKEAHLVEHLRLNGIDAYGIDRALQKKKVFLKEENWLETTFERNRWGTVISHMSFTNHFAYVEKFDQDQVPTYRTRYQEILESLKPGGSFIYTPDAPALEQTTDWKKYSVEKFEIGNGYVVAKVFKSCPITSR